MKKKKKKRDVKSLPIQRLKKERWIKILQKKKKWLLKKNKGRKQHVKVSLKTCTKKKVRCRDEKKSKKTKFIKRKKMLMKMLHKSNKTYVGRKQHPKNKDEENTYGGKQLKQRCQKVSLKKKESEQWKQHRETKRRRELQIERRKMKKWISRTIVKAKMLKNFITKKTT